MKTSKRIVVILAVIGLFGIATARGATVPSKTLGNLQSAFNGESNAHAKYIAFAQKAESEGYGKVASLFRAAAAAEEVHYTCEAAVIKGMNETPQADVKEAPVASTKQNLEDSANKGEAYERDTMYPRFIKQARKDGNEGAGQCFKYAQAAEAEHFKLFKAAANNLDQMKGGPQTYYVCSEGGYTMAKLNAVKCPGGKYEEVK